jgi:16S rRNA (guanine527-N7)-methyltransferase
VKKEGMTILSGKKAVDEAAREFPERLCGWITRGSQDPPEHGEGKIPWYRLSGALFREIDVHGAGSPLALMTVPDIPEWTDEPKETWPIGLTLFVPFQDPANVGAVIRSAAAFGAVRVVLLSGSANPYHHKSVRAAGTALFRVPLFRGPGLEELEVTGAQLYSLSAEGEGINTAVLPRTLGLLAGREGPGLPRRFREKRVLSIPMVPGVESLNAAAAVTVALFEWHRRHLAKGGGGR